MELSIREARAQFAQSIGELISPPLQSDPLHGDMLDELLLIRAQRLGAKLLTRDRKLLGHPLTY
jgi:hypothetical protein